MLILLACVSLLSPASTTDDVAGQEHIIEREGQKLYLWERRLETALDPEGHTDRVVLFLHGATWSGRPNFDLGIRDYSAMAHFAQSGWDAFCLDVQGYGKSDDPLNGSWCEAREATLDVHAAVEYLCRVRGVDRVHLIGWCWGSQVAGLYSEQHPERVARLVLYGTRWRELTPPRAAPTERFRVNDARGAASDFIEGCYEQDVVDAYVKAALAADPISPNGSLRDYYVNLPVMSPTKIAAPTLIIMGEFDAQEWLGDRLSLFATLPNADKRIVIIAGGGHAVHLEKPRARWWSAVLDFLDG